MFAFSLRGEKHMHAVWLLCNLTCILPDYYIVSISFFPWHRERENLLVFCLVISGICLGGCGARLCCRRTEFIRSVSLLLFLETRSGLGVLSLWLRAALQAYPKSREGCSSLITRAIQILPPSQRDKQKTKQQQDACCQSRETAGYLAPGSPETDWNTQAIPIHRL